MQDGVEVRPRPFAYSDHSASTTVFTSGNSEVFHADKHCHRLHRTEPLEYDGDKIRYIQAHELESVMTSWLNPVRPCSYCTLDIEKTADVAVEQDGVPEACLSYYTPGDKRVKTVVSTSPDGETTVTESESEVY